MGDRPANPQTPKHLFSHDQDQEPFTGHESRSSRAGGRSKGADTAPDTNPPFFTQFPNHSAQRSSGAQAFAYHNSIGFVPPHGADQSSALNMGQMVGTLPNYPGACAAPMALQQHQQAPIAYGQQLNNQPYLPQQMPYPAQYPQGQYPAGYYALGPSPQYPQPYPPQMYSPAQLYPNQPGQIYQTTAYQDPRVPVQVVNHQGRTRASHMGLSRIVSQPGRMTGQMTYHPNRAQDYNFPERSFSSGERATDGSRQDHGATTNISRGPPRKPRQSGHALWVGNLPPDATVTDLKDHFSREATNDIESLKLISKSSCAFVNYRTQAACASAMTRFHDSRFHGTRLVCRLRRTSAPSPATPAPGLVSAPIPTDEEDAVDEEGETPIEAEGASVGTIVPERFFVLKSLTLQDLEISTRNGMWATQSHNERVLNEAFRSAENVYLIFSANKSGEYFGYARMCSEISGVSEEGDLALDKQTTYSSDSQAPTSPSMASKSASGHGSGRSTPASDSGPKAIPTPATEWAPRGRIIDDLARGTIFWEADLEEASLIDSYETSSLPLSPIVDDQLVIASSTSSTTTRTSLGETDLTEEERDDLPGNAFRLQWLSTRKVPFFKTRGVRNPWNANREVKIARDGTEIETAVGKKLLALFGPANPRPSLSFN